MTHQTDLEGKIHEQAQQIRRMQLVLEEKNRMLDVLHMVWCDGGCPSGVHRFDGQGPEAITDATVDTAVAHLAVLLADTKLASHMKHAAVRYVGRLITWRASWVYRKAVRSTQTAAAGSESSDS